MENIDPNQIHLWFIHPAEIVDPRLLAEYWRMLSEEERARNARFHLVRDSHRDLVTRAALRSLLSQYAAVARPDWTFAPTVYGRPFLTNDDDLARRISFNISHSEDRIVVAIAIDRLLGVDVERVMPIEDMEEVAKAFFSPQEVQALRGLPLAQRNARFLEYWTLKESYIKACGQGLSLPLDKFWFQFPQAGTLQFNISNDLDADAQRWLFWQIESVPDYLVAVCSNHGPSRIPEIMMRSYVPLLGEQQPIHGTVVRISAV